ncbi:MAG: hypothetical protein NWS74_07545 [Salibacteraceae bacterium]|nr:hypothetical protein [Salibacteraceae bacterium]
MHSFGQDLKVYTVGGYGNSETMLYYVSLSDSYPYSENESDQDSIIPDEYLGDLENTEMLHFELKSEYRKRFMSQLKIAESDSVFVYFQQQDSVAAFAVSDWSLMAMINMYYSNYDGPVTFYDYVIGFDFSTIQNGDFVVIGTQNPFQTGKLKPVLWQETQTDQFPANTKLEPEYHNVQPMEVGKTYVSTSDNYTYYVQALIHEGRFIGRKLAVVHTFRKDIVLDYFLMDGESASSAPLNGIQTDSSISEFYQFAGELFIGKPPVIYGFQFESFGCPAIYFLNQNSRPIQTLCDNRH